MSTEFESPAVAAPSAAEHRAHARLRAVDRKIQAVKTQLAAQRSWMERVADWLSRVASSTSFLALHAAWFVAWIVWNGFVAAEPFDPFPFGFLTLVVSLEAIFLSIFVLMSQRRESQIAELRDELTLEIGMCTEEKATKTLQLTAGLYSRLNFTLSADDELRAMLQPLDRERIAKELAAQVRPPRPTAARRGGSSNEA